MLLDTNKYERLIPIYTIYVYILIPYTLRIFVKKSACVVDNTISKLRITHTIWKPSVFKWSMYIYIYAVFFKLYFIDMRRETLHKLGGNVCSLLQTRKYFLFWSRYAKINFFKGIVVKKVGAFALSHKRHIVIDVKYYSSAQFIFKINYMPFCCSIN